MRAKAQADPPFDPPTDFMPNMADLPEVRLLNWRTRWRFPDVDAGWWWLSEMFGCVTEGKPSVTEAEFAELADWFAANDERLYQLSLPSQLLDLGGGRKTSSANLRWKKAGGPRAKGVVEYGRGRSPTANALWGGRTMKLRARLGRAEGAAHKTFSSDHPPELTPREWLKKFEALGREEPLAAEPDYPVALAAYREALDKAQADLRPGEEMPALLARCQGRYQHVEPPPPEVEAAWKWLAEMLLRPGYGISRVTEAEFRVLAAWFGENADRLECTELLARGGSTWAAGWLTSTANLRGELGARPTGVRLERGGRKRCVA